MDFPRLRPTRRRRCTAPPRSAFRLAAVVLMCAPVVRAAPGDWTSFIDGTAYHVSPGAVETADRLKHDPIDASATMIWAGSSGGLTGFQPSDSTYTRLFRNDGLPSQDVTAVAVDGGGKLWLGSRADGLTARNPATGGFFPRALDRFDIGSDSVRVLVAVEDEVWVGTAAGAARLRYPADPSLPGEAVLEVINLASLLDASPYVNAIAARGDTVWFGTRRGVVRRSSGGFQILNDGIEPAAVDVRALAFFGDGLWCATAGGVFRFEGGSWVRRDSGLNPAFEPRALAIDEDELYLGVRAGDALYRLDAASLTWSAAATPVLQNRIVVGMAVQGGRLWAATNRGLHVRGTDGVWRRLPSVDPPGPEALFSDFDYVDIDLGQGAAWAITRSFVNRYRTGWDVERVGSGGLGTQDLSRVAVDEAGRLFLAHCCCEDPPGCALDTTDDPFNQDAVPLPVHNILGRAMAADGTLWFGSVQAGETAGQGVYRVVPASASVTRYTPSGGDGAQALPGMSSSAVQAVDVDSRGRLWMGHQSRGVDVWFTPGSVGSRLQVIDGSDGLPSNIVTAIATTGGGAWIGTATGLALVNADLLVIRQLGREDGLPAAEVTDVAVDGCGRVWAATRAGVAVFDQAGELQAVFDEGRVPGPVDPRVNALAIDSEAATVWLATQLGLSRFEYAPDCGPLLPGAGGGTDVEAPCTSFCPYPNPVRVARGQTAVYLAQAPIPVEVTVVDALGREIWRSPSRLSPDGPIWDLNDAAGQPVPSGLYVLSIDSGGVVRARRTLAVIR